MNRLPLFSILAALIFFASSQAFGIQQSSITIDNPTPNSIIRSNSLEITGSYITPNTNPSLSISINGKATTPFFYGGHWSAQAYLGDGWNTVKITLVDSNGNHQASEQFLIATNGVKTTKYNIIEVLYSQTCTSLIKTKNTDCPSLGELKKYDTSNQNISGKFILQKDGTWIRTSPQVKNHYTFYESRNSSVICIECNIDLGSPDIVQTLFIEPKGFSFVKHDFTTSVEPNVTINSTISVNNIDASLRIYHDRYVSDDCKSASMDYSPFLMSDTIGYLQSNCKTTGFNGTSISKVPNTPFSWNNPYSSLHQQSLVTQIKSTGGLGNCISKQCNFKDPYKKIGY